MDEKMMQMLTQLIEGQNETNKQLSELTNRVGGVEAEVGAIKSEVGAIKSEVGAIKSEVGAIKSEVGTIKSEVDRLGSKVDRNTILLEETQRHVKIVSEGLVAFREQVDRQFEEVHATLNEKTYLIETVIKVHSSEVNKLKDESKHIQGIIGEHEVSIRILKNQNP